GKTLDQRIPGKGLPLGEALQYAVQIADATSAAHGAGILHRDLKPGNVMVSEAGRVKVLDFGLAKLTEKSADSEVDATATALQEQKPLTVEGAILGTVSYMSPEQAEGKKLDTRSDIFSFGDVLYEMLCGRRAFAGESAVSTLAAILNTEPGPPPSVPRDVAKLVARCMKKDRAKRYQTMADLKVSLEELIEDPGT
ncbi:MAG: serine/threonine protein kinase, partial [bacterium]|nr:serine/threonine protein kinase [bacterium]